MAAGARGIRGLRARPSRRAPDLLELYSFESSPYARLVRERLCELEVPYILRNMGKEQLADVGTPGIRLSRGPYRPIAGGKRARLLERGGKVQIPYLVDSNTGAALYESREILDYLEGQYGGSNSADAEGDQVD